MNEGTVEGTVGRKAAENQSELAGPAAEGREPEAERSCATVRETCAKTDDPGWPEIVLTRMEEAATTASWRLVQSQDVCDQAQSDPSHEALEAVRDLVLDLRREIAMNTHAEREILLQLTQCVRKLTMEVRDLRYAFLLAASRKDRKRGLKTLSRLLHG